MPPLLARASYRERKPGDLSVLQVRLFAQMTYAAVTAQPLEPSVFLTGSASTDHVANLFGCSRWKVRRVVDIDAATEHLETGSIPVVICGRAEWRNVLEAGRRSSRPPAIIVISGAPDDAEWMEVLEAGAYYLDGRSLCVPELISIVSLLWRNWHHQL